MYVQLGCKEAKTMWDSPLPDGISFTRPRRLSAEELLELGAGVLRFPCDCQLV
jgi:hypothetical protein